MQICFSKNTVKQGYTMIGKNGQCWTWFSKTSFAESSGILSQSTKLENTFKKLQNVSKMKKGFFSSKCKILFDKAEFLGSLN
jgi:hypothetical protein